MKRAFAVMAIIVALGLGMLVGQSAAASFKDCYAKCFIICMINPSQTLCSCSTHCLKDCIFGEKTQKQDLKEDDDQSRYLGFCKLGCAFSMCSSIITKGKPNVDKMDDCVGSCSKTCTQSYSSP